MIIMCMLNSAEFKIHILVVANIYNFKFKWLLIFRYAASAKFSNFSMEIDIFLQATVVYNSKSILQN